MMRMRTWHGSICCVVRHSIHGILKVPNFLTSSLLFFLPVWSESWACIYMVTMIQQPKGRSTCEQLQRKKIKTWNSADAGEPLYKPLTVHNQAWCFLKEFSSIAALSTEAFITDRYLSMQLVGSNDVTVVYKYDLSCGTALQRSRLNLFNVNAFQVTSHLDMLKYMKLCNVNKNKLDSMYSHCFHFCFRCQRGESKAI